MSLLDDDKEVVLDRLRKAIAKHETRLANGRGKSRHPEVRHAQTFLKETLNALKHTLQLLEKSHEMIATSNALLEDMKQNGRPRSNHPGYCQEPPLWP